MDGISDGDETGIYYECTPQRASISKEEKMAQIQGYKGSRNSGVQHQCPTEDDEQTPTAGVTTFCPVSGIPPLLLPIPAKPQPCQCPCHKTTSGP